MKRNDLIEFAVFVADDFARAGRAILPGALADDLTALVRLGKAHRRLMERQCSDATWGPRDDARVAEIRRRIKTHAEAVAPGVRIGDDPRGCTVKLVLHTGRTNDFGGEGWCVPGA
ncbi:MAG: hypothetical protein WC789_10535 [Lentisphaeria bacterium]